MCWPLRPRATLLPLPKPSPSLKVAAPARRQAAVCGRSLGEAVASRTSRHVR